MIDLNNSLYECFNEIPGFATWNEINLIDKGWSNDLKFHIKTIDQEYLLRISEEGSFVKKIRQFEFLSKIKSKHARHPKALAIGLLSNNKVYSLLSYVEGNDLKDCINKYDIKTQYELGYKAGLFLKDVHKVKKKKDKDFFKKYKEKLDKKIDVINKLNIELPNKDLMINHILKNIDVLKDKIFTLNHGDYHIGNMVINDDLSLGIIDFGKLDLYQTNDDFKPFLWNVNESKFFASGIINGYFKNKIPKDFFKILSLYAAESMISHLPWSLRFGEKEINVALKSACDVLKWYDNFNLVIPTWYVADENIKK